MSQKSKPHPKGPTPGKPPNPGGGPSAPSKGSPPSTGTQWSGGPGGSAPFGASGAGRTGSGGPVGGAHTGGGAGTRPSSSPGGGGPPGGNGRSGGPGGGPSAGPAPRPTDLARRRLRSALDAARQGAVDPDTVKGLPVALRSMGFGQVLAHLYRSGDRRTAEALAAWAGQVEPELRRPDAPGTLEAWREVKSRAVTARVEAEMVAWAVDVKRLAPWCGEVERSGVKPARPGAAATGPGRGAPPSASARAALRRGQAAVAAFGLVGLADRVQALPYELQSEGLLRALAGLAAEGRGSARDQGAGARQLAELLVRRLVERFPEELDGATPARTLADVLCSEDRLPLAHACEAEARAWVNELKTYVSALNALQEGA